VGFRGQARDTKGDIPVKKYKTNKKMVQATSSHLTYASFTLTQDTDLGQAREEDYPCGSLP
jgi:hypothetical protein